MTGCERFQGDLKAYCDSELPILRRFAVRRHLAGCASCRQEVSQMEQMSADLRAGDTGALDPALRAKILTSAGSQAPVSSGPPPRASRNWRPALAWGAALSLCAIVFTSMGHRTFGPVNHSAYQMAKSYDIVSSRLQENENFMAKVAGEAGPAADLNKVNPEDRAKLEKLYQGAPITSKDALKSWIKTYGSEPVASPQAAASSPDPMTDANPPSMGLNHGAASLNMPVDMGLRRVHKEGSLTVEVANPEAKGNEVEQMVKSVGGFVATNTLTTGDDGLKLSNMTVKVPVVQFESMVAQIAKLGDVKAKNITGEDITEKVSDSDRAESVLEDEVKKADAQLKLKGSKSKWRDEETARDLRIQLSQTQARLQLLKKMGDLATITISLTEKAKPTPPVQSGFLPDMKATTSAAIQSVLAAASTLFAIVIWILAYAPIWVPVLIGGRYVTRALLRRNAAPQG